LAAETATPEQAVKAILATAGVQGGLVVHLGCGDGRLTAALRINDKYTVHGLDADAARIEAARAYLSERGLYGVVSVERLGGATLPYADNLINLVIAEDPGLVSRDEIMRVLAPEGVAYVRQGGGWEKSVKLRPKEIDEWTHYLHDAGNNAVARDEQVAPPRSLKWLAPPLWLRSHETPSGIQALVASGGRLFYFFDEGLVGITDQRLPERWSLVCRDAFNGKQLWKKPLQAWGWPQWAKDRFSGISWTEITGGRTAIPEENQRRLVALGDRLYATLSYRAPLSILDAATGEVLRTVPETEPVQEILASEGIVLVHARDPLPQAGKRREARDARPSTLIAVDGKSGKVLWKKVVDAITPLFLAIDGGRVYFRSGARMCCLSLADGQPAWEQRGVKGPGRTLIAHGGVLVAYVGTTVQAWDGSSGQALWQRDVPPSSGAESPDLFVTGGIVWRGMIPVNEDLKAVNKSEDALALGFDLRTGEQKKKILARKLRSPEHHHRCYRNKATERYIISGMEGVEFMDLQGKDHCQNNWLRGACKLGIMPCNGLLYVPSDQCFCQPGAKLLGFAAVAGNLPARKKTVPDDQRLEKGAAYAAEPQQQRAAVDDWPTFRHDAARHGTTTAAVPAQIAAVWRTPIGGRLTQPVVAGNRVYVVASEAHTVHALDLASGKEVWKFIAGGRIDSPPTVFRGQVLFGCADGRVYSVRASDGVLAWRFLAAPSDCRIAVFDQVESVWPVHGSVLVHQGVAYACAGRSSYLDGGLHLYALDPLSGRLLHQTTFAGPPPGVVSGRDEAFWVPGANSDVLVCEGNYLYLRQKKFTLDLKEVTSPVLSSKGEQDVGLHVFSTSGLLDASGYNRAFWMYAKRWPGFQLANQAPKSGQILVVDGQNTYALQPFYRRNVHSLMFFPAKEGYLLYADRNDNEPQIVGEAGARPPVAWLPQSHIPRPGNPGLESPAFGLDKMIGYTRAAAPLWKTFVPIRVQAMVKAADTLYIAGPPDVLDGKDPYAAFEGRHGARLASLNARDGARLGEIALDAAPVFDGLIAARGALLMALADGSVVCLSSKR
jgi:outer membrane protein assembly factor BamB